MIYDRLTFYMNYYNLGRTLLISEGKKYNFEIKFNYSDL